MRQGRHLCDAIAEWHPRVHIKDMKIGFNELNHVKLFIGAVVEELPPQFVGGVCCIVALR